MEEVLAALLGAAVALLGTVAVQWWLTPKAQARIRQRERWEKDAYELANMVAKTVPDAVFDYEVKLREQRAIYDAQRKEKAEDSVVKKTLDETSEAVWQCQETVRKHLNLLGFLITRLQHLNIDAPRWEELDELESRVSRAWGGFLALWILEEPPSRAEIAECRDEFSNALDNLSDWVGILVFMNRPPRRPSLHRRIRARIRQKKEVTASPEQGLPEKAD